MDKKDLFIKSKLQEDKNIPKDIDELIKNFKGGDIKMENNFNKSRKGKVAKIIAIAACFILVALVGVVLLGQQNGQIIKVGGKDKVEGRKDLDIKDNNQSTAVKKVSYSKLNELLVNELSKGGNVASNNKIKSVNINEITIFTNEYCEAQGLGYLSEEYKDKVVGYCVYTMDFENIEGLVLAGSQGKPYGHYKNTLLNGTVFTYNPETGKLELEGMIDFVNEGAANRQTIYDIEIDNSIGNNDVFAKIYDKQYKMLVETGGKVASNNKIKKVFINSIQIDTEEYLKAQNLESTPANKIEGYCSFTMEFENIEGLELAGSQGKVHGIIGNYLVEGGPWDYNKSEIEGVDKTTENSNTNVAQIIKKQDKTKNLVYDLYNEKGKKYDYKVPYINIDSNDVKDINQKILEKVKDDLKQARENDNREDYNNSLIGVEYDAYTNDNILSVIISYKMDYNDVVHYDVYNIDIYTGKIVSNLDILKKKNITQANFLQNVKKALEKTFRERYKDAEDLEYYQEYLNNTISDNNYSIDIPMFLDNNYKLNVIGYVYALAGPGGYDCIINLGI